MNASDYRQFMLSGLLAVATGVIHYSKILEWMADNKPPDTCWRMATLSKFWLEAAATGKWTEPHLKLQLGEWLMGQLDLAHASKLRFERSHNDGQG